MSYHGSLGDTFSATTSIRPTATATPTSKTMTSQVGTSLTAARQATFRQIAAAATSASNKLRLLPAGWPHRTEAASRLFQIVTIANSTNVSDTTAMRTAMARIKQLRDDVAGYGGTWTGGAWGQVMTDLNTIAQKVTLQTQAGTPTARTTMTASFTMPNTQPAPSSGTSTPYVDTKYGTGPATTAPETTTQPATSPQPDTKYDTTRPSTPTQLGPTIPSPMDMPAPPTPPDAGWPGMMPTEPPKDDSMPGGATAAPSNENVTSGSILSPNQNVTRIFGVPWYYVAGGAVVVVGGVWFMSKKKPTPNRRRRRK